jgi:hypothetical protein
MIRKSKIGTLTREQLDWCRSHIPAFRKASDQVQAAIAEMEVCKQKFSDQLKASEMTREKLREASPVQ